MPVTHGTKLYANVKCVNHVEYSSTKTSEHITVSFHEPGSENAEVRFIPQSEFGTLPISSAIGGANIQSNRTRVEFSWKGFADLSEISFYEYRILSNNGQLTDWVNVGKKTFTSVDFAGLANGQNCTAEVRAVNTGNYRSRSISGVILIQSRGPQLTGTCIVLLKTHSINCRCMAVLFVDKYAMNRHLGNQNPNPALKTTQNQNGK